MPTVITEQLRELAEDFGRRLSQWDWWEDALLVVGTYPKGEDDIRTIAPRVYLVGPPTEEPPTRVLSRSTQGSHEWALIPYPDAVDEDLFTLALATKPLPQEGKYLNLLVVHFARVEGGAAKGRFGFAHHQQLEQLGAEPLLNDIAWVRNTLAEIGACVLP